MAEHPQARFAPSPLLVLAISISAGIFTGHFAAPHTNSILTISVTAGVGFALVAIVLITRKVAAAFACVVPAFFCAGMALALIDNDRVAPNRISRLYDEGIIAVGDPVELTGVVAGQPEVAPDGFYLSLRSEQIRIKGVERLANGSVLLFAQTRDEGTKQNYDTLELRHGARVRMMLTLDREENFRNPGALSFTEYLDRKGFDATGVIKSPLLVERLDDAKVFLPLAWLYEWRARLEKEFSAKFSTETAGVLDAALLGNRYNVSQSAAERLRDGGAFHVLVIAGLHISFVAAVLYLLARVLFRRRLVQFLFAGILLWAYVIAVGLQEPVVRAASMCTLVGFAPLVWRRANSLNVIGGAALGLLIWRPSDLFDPSFQLTFLSVLSIVSLAVPTLRKLQSIGSWRPTIETPYPPDGPGWFRMLSEALFWSEREWRREMAGSNVRYRLFKSPIAKRLERWRLQRPLRYAFGAMVVSLSVQIGMMPVLVIYFHRLSIVSPLLNIFVGALLAMLAFVALIAVALSHISLWLATPVIFLANKIDWLMIHLVDPFARLGLASIRLPHYSGWPAFVYGVYYLSLGILVMALARWNPLRPFAAGRKKRRRTLGLAIVTFLFGFAAIVFHPFSAPRPDGKLHVDFLDVGQGDSALLTMPDGTTVMIDGGGRPNFRGEDDSDQQFERDTRSIGEGVVSEFLWARGLDRVDYLMPTHADADHIDGLKDVARNFKVRGAIVARTPFSDAEYVQFAARMKEAGVPIERIGAGDVLHFGEVVAEVMWPPPAADSDLPWRNNDCLVLRVRYGDKVFLFTADIEKQAEANILNEKLDLRSNVIKVAHHGSRTSSTEAFISATRPSLAIISVGRTSIFGHPHKEVVERWRASGARVMTTGQRGTITIVTDGRELSVSTFVP